MRRLALLVSSVALLAAGPPAAPLRPTGKWLVNFDDAQCLAEREYGTPDDPLRLVLKQPASGSIIQVAVLRKGGVIRPSQTNGSIGFDAGPRTRLSALHFRPATAKHVVRLLNVPQEIVAASRDAKVLHLQAGALDKSFALTDMRPLMKIMDECVSDLRRVWNTARDERERELQEANPRGLRGLFKAEDYPERAVRSFQSGATRIAVLVDEQGKVADCSVVETSGVAVLDAQSCAVIRDRAKFKPARDVSGKAIKSGFIQRIHWRME